MELEWDQRKADSNLEKHGVDFADAATVLFDDMAITVLNDSVNEEERYVTLVWTLSGGASLSSTRGGRKSSDSSQRESRRIRNVVDTKTRDEERVRL